MQSIFKNAYQTINRSNIISPDYLIHLEDIL